VAKKQMSLEKGYIHVYTGNGKGKTTAALGQALRAAGSGLKTYMISFMKDFPYGELRSMQQINQWIRLEQYGNDAFVLNKEPPGEKDFRAAKKAFQKAQEAMVSGEFDIVIMDEICIAIYFGLFKKEQVLSMLEQKPEPIELILTGRYCPEELIEIADIVTEMVEIKHYYQKGVLARRGIES
jgi:cob(I)alamin adenosyltransferase